MPSSRAAIPRRPRGCGPPTAPASPARSKCWRRPAARSRTGIASGLPPLLDAARVARIFLAPDRAALYRRIDARFDAMLAAGALEEVRALAARRLDPLLPAMKAHGVPWLIRHLAGEMSLDAAAAEAKKDTRHYAKRQFTWFRHQLADWPRVEPGARARCAHARRRAAEARAATASPRPPPRGPRSAPTTPAAVRRRHRDGRRECAMDRRRSRRRAKPVSATAVSAAAPSASPSSAPRRNVAGQALDEPVADEPGEEADHQHRLERIGPRPQQKMHGRQRRDAVDPARAAGSSARRRAGRPRGRSMSPPAPRARSCAIAPMVR